MLIVHMLNIIVTYEGARKPCPSTCHNFPLSGVLSCKLQVHIDTNRVLNASRTDSTSTFLPQSELSMSKFCLGLEANVLVSRVSSAITSLLSLLCAPQHRHFLRKSHPQAVLNIARPRHELLQSNSQALTSNLFSVPCTKGYQSRSI